MQKIDRRTARRQVIVVAVSESVLLELFGDCVNWELAAISGEEARRFLTENAAVRLPGDKEVLDGMRGVVHSQSFRVKSVVGVLPESVIQLEEGDFLLVFPRRVDRRTIRNPVARRLMVRGRFRTCTAAV